MARTLQSHPGSFQARPGWQESGWLGRKENEKCLHQAPQDPADLALTVQRGFRYCHAFLWSPCGENPDSTARCWLRSPSRLNAQALQTSSSSSPEAQQPGLSREAGELHGRWICTQQGLLSREPQRCFGARCVYFFSVHFPIVRLGIFRARRGG